jgi:DNA-binding MarR family transcriptional regulator
MTSEKDQQSQRMQEMMLEFQGLFESIAHKAKQKMQHVTSNFQLANGQIFVLMMLHRKEICKASDIAALLGITSGAVTGLTDKLVNMELLNRIRSEEDRRLVLFTLTDKGRDILKQIREERMKLLLGMFGKLEDEDLEKMLDVFTKLNKVLD